MQQFTIGTNQAGQRLDKYLRRILPGAQDSFLYKMLRKKNITLNGKKAEGKELLQAGDEVTLFFSPETFEEFAGPLPLKEDIRQTAKTKDGPAEDTQYLAAFTALKGIDVLYEDEHVLILNKPAGILSQKSAPKDVSVNEWMIGYLLQNGTITPKDLHLFRPSVCNRLDRNTSGLILCGKSLAGSQELSKLLKERKVRKFYRALADGCIARPARIEGYLTKDTRKNRAYLTDSFSGEEGAYISTQYRPLMYQDKLSYLEIELITGKTHQIRVHLAGIGHPVIGDYKYGNRQNNEYFREKYGITGQLLHACRLEFPQLEGPLSALSGRHIAAPLPPLFKRVLADFFKELPANI